MESTSLHRRALLAAGLSAGLGSLASARTTQGNEPGPGGDTAGWDRVFGRETPPYNTEANAFLAAALERMQREELLPGKTALDLAMGDGRNALLMAERGLEVTGLDISKVALAQARAKAAEQGLTLDAREQDLFAYDYGEARWDLLSVLYFNPAVRILESLKKAVKPGGLIAIEGQGSEHTGEGPPPATRFRPNQLLQVFSDWRVRAYEDGRFACDWAPGPPTHVVRILAQKPAAGAK